MTGTWDAFERYKQKGLDARRAGQWDSARIYLLEAARSMVDLSKQTGDEQLKQARHDTAARLLELARDCDVARAEKRSATRPTEHESSAESSSAAKASDWIVREKPDIRFDDVAGLEEVKEDIRLKMLYPFEHP